MQNVPSNKIYLKMSSTKRWPFCSVWYHYVDCVYGFRFHYGMGAIPDAIKHTAAYLPLFFNSLWPNDAIWSALVQLMTVMWQTITWTCADLLSIRFYGTDFNKSHLKFKSFHWRKWFWKYRQQIVNPFIRSSMCYAASPRCYNNGRVNWLGFTHSQIYHNQVFYE